MKARQYKKLIKHLTVLQLHKNDIVCLNLKTDKATAEQLNAVDKKLKEFFPKHKTLIFANGYELGVIREK